MRTLLLFVSLIIFVNTYSQAPQSFKYQATARNNSGELILNQEIGMQISVIQGSANGTVAYVETFSPTTNEFGLININIGTGNSSDDFSAIDWANGPYFIKIEMDVTGGTSYQDFGTSQLLSVPYALYANNSATTNYSFSPTSPSGFQNITPITILIDDNNYTVPNGKILYILNIYTHSNTNKLLINSISIAGGYYNVSGLSAGSYQHLSQPLIAGEDDIISGVGYIAFNGYLIDK